MGIEPMADGRTRIRHPYRRNGVATWAQVTVDSQDKRIVAKAMLELVNKCEGSLTSITYKELSQHYLRTKGDQGMPWHYERLEKVLGSCKVNSKFSFAFDKFIGKCRADGWATNTIANVASVVQRVLRYSYATSMIDEIPIRDFHIERVFRTRVLVGDEQQRLFNVMAACNSPLYWSVRFMLERPVRGRSDLWTLTDEDFVQFGPGSPYIKYRPEKTARKVQKDAHLPLCDISADILGYLRHGRPKGCRLLFPRSDGTPMGYPIKHWRWLCKQAKIDDFRLHDLKHEAITHMIRDRGYSMEMLEELGIQHSPRSIRAYWNKNAVSVLEKLTASRSISVATENSVSAEKWGN